MAFKMSGWQSHSGSPHKFIGKRFRKMRRAAVGAIGGLLGFGGGGSRSGSGFGPGAMRRFIENQQYNAQHANTSAFVPPAINNTDIEGVAFGKKKKTKNKKKNYGI